MVVTQCPECHALFRVSEGQVRLAQGQVRCGACLTVFNANTHALKRVNNEASQPKPNLADDSQSSSNAGFSTHGSAARVVRFNKELDNEQAQAAIVERPAEPRSGAPLSRPTGSLQQSTAKPKVQTHQEPSFDPALIPQIKIDAEPIILHNRAQTDASPVAVLFWTLCVLIGITALTAQYLWFERATLANQSSLRPFYQIACERVVCDLSANQGLASLKPDQVIARPHQQFNDLISLAIRINNDAAFAQPYPAIEISFTDLKGNLVSRRTFQPQQYLGDRAGQALRLPAGLDIEVNIPLTSPGAQAVSYEIRLHQSKT